MGRRTVLLIVAALIAALGTGMVFLYVQRSRQPRRSRSQSRSQVLKADEQIEPGETLDDARRPARSSSRPVPPSSLVPGALTDLGGDRGQAWSRSPRSTPASRSSRGKFGARPATSRADHPRRADRDLGQPHRHRPRRRLRLPGRRRRDLRHRRDDRGYDPACCCSEGRGHRRRRTTTVTTRPRPTPSGAQTTEQLPRRCSPSRSTSQDARRSCCADASGDLDLRPRCQRQLQGQPGPGRHDRQNLFR